MSTPAVIYAARSAAERDRDATSSTASQIEAVRVRLGDREPLGVFCEDGYSASKGNRGPELQRAIDAATAASAEHGAAELWAFHSSRFARGSGRLGEARALGELFYDLRRRGVALRTVEDDAFVSNEEMIGIASSQARKYAEDLGAHTRRGYDAAREAGKPLFGIVPDGYAIEYDHDAAGRVAGRRMIKDPERAPLWRMIWALAVEGYSDRAIVLEVDAEGWKTAPRKKGHRPRAFDANRIRLALANPTYAGLQVHRGEVVGDGNWEAYVSVDDFERVRAIRAERAHVAGRVAGRPPLGYLLAAGLGRCGTCGARLDCVTGRNVRVDGTRKRSYVCRTHRERPQDCAAKPIDAAAIDAAIITNLENLLGDVDDVRARIAAGRKVDRQRLEQEAAHAKVDADEADRRAARAKRIAMDAADEKADAAMDVYADHRAEAARARTRLNAALDALDAPESETEEAAFYDRLHTEIAGRIGDAGGDVRRVNAALADLFESFTLTTTNRGTVIRPALSPDAAARILRDVDRWPHPVTTVYADGHRIEHGARMTLEDIEAVERGAGQDVRVEIGGPEPFTPETLSPPW